MLDLHEDSIRLARVYEKLIPSKQFLDISSLILSVWFSLEIPACTSRYITGEHEGMFFVQISDLHVRPRGKAAYGIVNSNAMLEAAVEHINALDPQPDFVIATGDLTDYGLPEEYDMLREIMVSLRAPLRLVMGNHDVREHLQTAFRDHLYLPQKGAFVQYVLDHDPVRFIVLDSVLPGSHEGQLCPQRLHWLEAQLAEAPSKPTVIALHHPPFDNALRSSFEFPGVQQFGEIVARHPQIERIICGHNHRTTQLRWRGTCVSVCPGTAHQSVFRMRLNDDALMSLSPPSFHVHIWKEDVGLITHVVPFGQYPGPYYVTWERERPDAATNTLWQPEFLDAVPVEA